MERRLMILVSALMLFVASSEPLCAQWSMLDGDPVWVYRQSVNATIKNAPKEVRQFNVEPLLFYHTYYIKGDTTIQNRVYKKLYHEYLNGKVMSLMSRVIKRMMRDKQRRSSRQDW